MGRSAHRAEEIGCLTELSLLREIASTPYLLRFAFSKDREVRRVARASIRDLLQELDSRDLLSLSEILGWRTCRQIGLAWSQLEPSRVAKLAAADGREESEAMLGLLSFHPNGFVREQAVKRLAKCEHGFEVPYLLIRLNDWVAQICAAAQAAICSRLTADYAAHFVTHFELVAHLPEFGRNNVASTADAVTQLLLQDEDEDRLALLCRTAKPGALRRFIRRAFRMEGDHYARLARHGIESHDVVARLWSARYWRDSDCDATHINKLLRDSFPPIRRMAYEMKAKHTSSDGVEVWKQAALDRSSSVRELARYHLQKEAGVDLRELYRQSLSAAPDSLPALAGLSDVATESDISVLRSYAHHPHASRRRVAIAGLARVLGERCVNELLEMLTDDSASVVRQVVKQLRAYAPSIDGGEVFERLERSRTDAAKLAIVELIDALGKWKGLAWLLRCTGIGNALVAEMASDKIHAWLVTNRVYTKPTEAERAAIVQALTDVQDSLPPSLTKQLRESLPISFKSRHR